MRQLDQVIDTLRGRFGNFSVQRGMMLQDSGLSNVDAKEDHTIHPTGYFQDGDKTGLDKYLKKSKE